MNVIRCNNGHFYDSDVFPVCPYCDVNPMGNTDLSQETISLSGILDEETVRGDIGMNFGNDGGIMQTEPMANIMQNEPVMQTEPAGDVGSLIDNGISDDRELGQQLTERYLEETNDDEKTIGLSFSADGINPVVGWIVCEEGPERGRSYNLYSGRNFIGRLPSSDIAIYEDAEISGENHCSIIYDPVSYSFFINPSANAVTHLNGEVLKDATPLKNNDAFAIGASKFRMIAYCKKGRAWK